MSDKDDLWTADDIRQNATNWSLHCDGKLLEYMKNLSKTIQERGSQTNLKLHNSMVELDRTKIALENATNQLMALQHKQFVENRVYDDDETLANVDNVPTQQMPEEPDISPSEAIREFVKSGIDVMNQYFDKVTIELSDSEDEGEDVQKDIVWKLKDRYKHRPLPYLIGSKEWHEKWHIGLAEDDEEEEEEDNDEEENVESADDEEDELLSSPAISVSSNVPVSLSESENPISDIPPRKSDALGLFHSSSEENFSERPHNIADNSTFQRQSHETPNILPIAKQIDSRETSNTIFRQQKQPQISHAIPTLIDSDPPDLDATVKTTKNVHKTPNLFMDDEDDDDDFMFDTSNKVDKPVSVERITEKSQMNVPSTSKMTSINVFTDDDGDIDSFLPSMSTAKTTQKSEIKNLFDDDDDDDDELFLQPSEPVKTITPRTTILSNSPHKPDLFQHNIFDDEPPEDDFNSQPSTSKTSFNPKPLTSESVKKSSNLLNFNLFGNDDDDDDDIFDKLITSSNSSKKDSYTTDSKNKISFETETNETEKIEEVTKKPRTEAKLKMPTFDPGHLFDDTPPSDDEQLFSSMSSKKETPKPKPMEVSKQKTGEFYNDFSETLTSVPQVSESESSVFIKPSVALDSLEPNSTDENPAKKSAVDLPENPVDRGSNDQQLVDKLKAETNIRHDDGTISEKRSDFLKKIDNFTNASTIEQKSETISIPKARQPKKLKIANIDINVAALLPGAKRTKSVEKSDNKEASDDYSNDESPLSPTTVKMIDQDNVDNSGRLTNLNRNRAKNLSKRPSTRAGRKQQYQKSIESEEQIDGIENQTQQSESISELSPELTLVKDESKRIDEEKEIEKETVASRAKILPTSPLSKRIFEDDFFESTTSSKNVDDSNQLGNENLLSEEKNVDKENAFSFLDDEQPDEIDEFLIRSKTPPPTSSTNTTIKATPAYIDELPPDLDPIDDQPANSKSSKGNLLLSQNALSLFGDDDDDFDNDDMFGSIETDRIDNQPEFLSKPEEDWTPYSTKYDPETPSSSNDKKLRVSSTLSLFDDNLENDDDIFSSKPSTEPKSQAKEQKHSTNEMEVPSPVSTDEKLAGSSVVGLFDDDDDTDDHNLFSTIKSTESKKDTMSPKQLSNDSSIASQTQLVQPQPVSSRVGLFDDDIDNNAIFDTKSSNQIRIEATEEKSQMQSQPKKKAIKVSLFGDDDEDDDDNLFGKPPPLSEPIKQIQTVKADSKIFSDDSSDDDLFGGKKTVKKIPPKSTSSITATTTTTTASATKIKPKSTNSEKLFSSDDDDDDDLFGSKSKPIESSKKLVSAVTSKRTKEESSNVKTLSPSAIDNDPLADLLK